jgi:hypothetical protein
MYRQHQMEKKKKKANSERSYAIILHSVSSE